MAVGYENAPRHLLSLGTIDEQSASTQAEQKVQRGGVLEPTCLPHAQKNTIPNFRPL
jgi:hypothetical protein